MAWFDLFKDNPQRYQAVREYLDYLERNKGKFVPVIDDITGKPLTENELKILEDRILVSQPYIIEEQKDSYVDEVVLIAKEGRKYKPKRKQHKRIAVSKKASNKIQKEIESK